MEIMVATNNRHKLREIRELFPASRILSPGEAGIEFFHEETGNTFLENALGKASALQQLSGRPVLADDSGLVVPSLDYEPGIYSARYGDESFTDEMRNDYLLKCMEGLRDRRAWFVCALVVIIDAYRHISVQERVDGSIALSPCGSGGFGYDPVFYLPEYGCTMAELPPEEKHRISHRGKAGRAVSRMLDAWKETQGEG